jgi:class 3 adenylate cyclase/tetratricopeptide (TPR) repeat protein
MTFEEILEQAIAMLQRRGRLTYRALKRQFDLDDAYLDDLKHEIIEGQRLAVDEQGTVLVWTGEAASAPATGPAQDRVPLTYTPPHLTEKILTARVALEGERKQVTVLFADIKGSTELIASLDPEAARRLLDPTLHLMMEAVHRFEGTVNQVLGDGIMALFGAPVAHEDHAVRACYAALAMQAAMQRYAEEVRRTQGLAVQMRVGLNAGEVVVRAIGNDLHMDYSAVGQTTHLAARMEQLATPGSVLLTATTLRLVEGLVRVNALGPVPVKGLTEPVEVFELVGVTAVRQRLQAAAARGLSRFVGRDHELESLQQAQQQAGAGYGQMVAAVGEAGVGKSRLVYEFVHSHRTQGWLVLESASVSYGKATPYFPVLNLLRRYCHLEDGDDARTVRAKVTGQVLTLDSALQEAIPALLSLLDVIPENDPFLQLDPPQRRQRTLNALKQVLLRESQVQPLVLVFEDLHWIDTETQALLDSLIESLPSARVLLLVNYRPEYQHGWGSKTYYTQLRLDPLPPASASILLQALLGDDPSLAPLTQFLIARTQGNPFFLEESARTLVEMQVLVGERGAYRLVQALPGIQVPATVQAVLAARIDRLPPEEKQLLQTAAVIGTEVSMPLLEAIVELPEEILHRGLAHLQAAEFLYETHLFPECIYTFKHALTHEVAYGSLLQERRQVLHARVVAGLERLYSDRLDEQVERLAQHAFRGEVWDKACTYYRQAGVKAMDQSAYPAVVVAYEQALEALEHLPHERERLEQGIDLLLALRPALVALSDHERLLSHLHTAETLATTLNDQRWLGRICSGLVGAYRGVGNSERALTYSQRCHALAITCGDMGFQIVSSQRLGQIYYDLGGYHQAMACFRSNMASLQGALLHERFDVGTFNALPALTARTYLVLRLAEVGGFAEGIAYGDEALRLVEGIDRRYDRVVVPLRVGRLHLCQGNVSKAIPLLEQALALSHGADMQLLVTQAAASLAVAYAWSERITDTASLLDQTPHRTDAVLRCSEAYLLAGRVAEARQLAQRALAHARDHQEQGHQAQAWWLLGEIAMHGDPSEIEPAVVHYRQALALAEELGMRPLVTHCHRGLGTVYAKMGQHEQARGELGLVKK